MKITARELRIGDKIDLTVEVFRLDNIGGNVFVDFKGGLFKEYNGSIHYLPNHEVEVSRKVSIPTLKWFEFLNQESATGLDKEYATQNWITYMDDMFIGSSGDYLSREGIEELAGKYGIRVISQSQE